MWFCRWGLSPERASRSLQLWAATTAKRLSRGHFPWAYVAFTPVVGRQDCEMAQAAIREQAVQALLRRCFTIEQGQAEQRRTVFAPWLAGFRGERARRRASRER
jgi:hypothetical protein